MFIRVEYERRSCLVNWFNGKFFVVIAYILYLRPRKVDSWYRFIILLINVEAKSRYT